MRAIMSIIASVFLFSACWQAQSVQTANVEIYDDELIFNLDASLSLKEDSLWLTVRFLNSSDRRFKLLEGVYDVDAVEILKPKGSYFKPIPSKRMHIDIFSDEPIPANAKFIHFEPGEEVISHFNVNKVYNLEQDTLYKLAYSFSDYEYQNQIFSSFSITSIYFILNHNKLLIVPEQLAIKELDN